MCKLRKIVLITLALVTLGTAIPGIASDTDAPPFLIYVDPITGKYTKKRPEHEAAPQQTQTDKAVTNIPRQYPPETQIFPAIILAGGLLLGSHLLSRVLIGIKKP
ncbi:MAG: hypothetical protein HKN08_11115 [Gammaproteobacteria bacterium]|nr:hypothetical protein [Gammaproteobacteria bacterium]